MDPRVRRDGGGQRSEPGSRLNPARRPWHGIVPPEDEALYRLAGFGNAGGIGRKPALLVIDVQYRTVGSAPRPIREAIREYPTSCGDAGWCAVAQIAKLAEAFRRRGLPILYPHIAPKSGYDRGAFAIKVPGVMEIPPEGYRFVAEVAPHPGDILIPKNQASAFFGTSLASYLVGLGVDSLVFSGCTTSGCVRASVVDACSLNYKVLVAEDAVFDRSAVVHGVSLFDIASKYGDVMPTDAVIAAVNRG
jgi:maleamate amidohydrolase